ncbi:sensor histidine kinase [Tenacibaculum geojense]|uniref:histidine kinase n=1 Tax=Tenacibaculum geojense TaxID=915352 RepID=A0ABW3JVA3_9FLAO
MLKEILTKSEKNKISILSKIDIIFIILSFTVCLTVIFAWISGNKSLLSILPNGATMKFNTALVLCLLTTTILLNKQNSLLTTYIHNAILVFVISVALITLLSYVDISIIDIDNIFVMDTLSQNNPGRMSPATAISSILASFGFIGLKSKNIKIKYTGEAFAFLTITICLIALISFILQIPISNKAIFFKTMAIHTSLLFMGISFSLLFNNKDSVFRKLFILDLVGSKLLRRLLPVIILFSIILSYTILLAINNNKIDSSFGLVFYTALSIPLIVGYISILAIDINKAAYERRELKHKLQNKNRDLEQFIEGLEKVTIIAKSTPDGYLKYVNDKFCEISKYSREELINQHFSIISSGFHSKDFYDSMWETITKGNIWTGDVKHKDKNGNYYWVYTGVVPFKDEKGNITENLIIKYDISQRKKQEKILKSKYVQQLEFKNKELEQFAYVASHDLQEPLRTIISFTQLMQESNYDNLDDLGKRSMNYVLDASERMSTLIKGLLDYSRLDKDHTLELIDCNELIKEVIEDLSKKIEETNTTIKYNELPTIVGYKLPLRLLFQNLISNSIKFTKEGVSPIIEIFAEKTKGKWQFSVKDNGIGIAENYQKKIFIIFQRLHNRTEYEGTGIGLAHCKKIVDLHGGDIWVNSVENNGSTFHFTIPKTKTNDKTKKHTTS